MMGCRTLGELVRDRAPLCVEAEASVRRAAQAMTERRVGALAVLEDGRLVGLVSERDLMCRVMAPGLDPDTTPVARVMTRELRTLPPEGSLFEALELMIEGHFRHMPVVEGGRLVGMVSIRDIPLENQLMRENWHRARHALDGVRARPG